VMDNDLELGKLFLPGDDGLMHGAEMDGAPPRPAKGYTVVSLAWAGAGAAGVTDCGSAARGTDALSAMPVAP
jgi:hypothetical protein